MAKRYTFLGTLLLRFLPALYNQQATPLQPLFSYPKIPSILPVKAASALAAVTCPGPGRESGYE